MSQPQTFSLSDLRKVISVLFRCAESSSQPASVVCHGLPPLVSFIEFPLSCKYCVLFLRSILQGKGQFCCWYHQLVSIFSRTNISIYKHRYPTKLNRKPSSPSLFISKSSDRNSTWKWEQPIKEAQGCTEALSSNVKAG